MGTSYSIYEIQKSSKRKKESKKDQYESFNIDKELNRVASSVRKKQKNDY